MTRLLATHLVTLDKPSVAALACSSKLLVEAALDPLWERLEKGPRPLMRCLPQDTWEIRDSEFVSTTCCNPQLLGLPLDRFSYAVLRRRNGADSRAMLAGFTLLPIPWEIRRSRWQRFRYYPCTLQLSTTICFRASVPSTGSWTRGRFSPSSDYS